MDSVSALARKEAFDRSSKTLEMFWRLRKKSQVELLWWIIDHWTDMELRIERLEQRLDDARHD